MAGIFSDVSTDIQKLRQLKAEIESVKKSLKSINVSVEIDIAKGIEERLRSLTTQYDFLIKKIADAEAKITLSSRRINEASEKIIKTQERITHPKSENSQSTALGSKEEVEEQTKAYEELSLEIGNVIGTRTQNIKRMLDEQNAIRLINEEIKRLTKYQSGNSTLTEAQRRRLEQLNNSLLTHKAALSEVRQTLMNNVRLDNAAATSMKGLSQSLSRMKIAYRELTEEERNSSFGKELLASIQQADAKIKELDATIGNHQRNVGDYAKGYSGLNMSVQQIVRELPSAAMGLEMFFLAISNNVPVLTDEIKRAKAANEELRASGQKGIPVWKQLASSLFSWQTAMMVGITLLTTHGKGIGDWFSSLFKAKEETLSLADAQKKLNKEFLSSDTGIGKQIVSVTSLSERWKALGDNMEAKKKFIRNNRDELNQLGVAVENVNDAENLLAKNTSAYIEAMSLRAQAAAAFKLASEQAEKAIKKKTEGDKEDNKGVSMGDRMKSYWMAGIMSSEGAGIDNAPTPKDFFEDRVKEIREEQKVAEEAAKQLTDIYTDLKKQANDVLDKTGIKKEKDFEGKEAKEATDYISQLADAHIKAQQTTEKLRLQIMMDGIAKRKTAARQEYDETLADIDKLERDTLARMNKTRKQGGVIPDGQYESVKETARTNRLLAEQVYNEQIFQIEQQYRDKSAQALIDYAKEYGTYQEKRLAIAGDYARRIAKAETEGERMSLAKERDKELQTVDFEELKKGMDWQKLFGDLNRVSEDTLEALRHKLKDYLENIGDDISPESFKEVMDAFENMDAELADRSPFKHLKEGYADYMDSMEEVQQAELLLNQTREAGSIIVEEYNEETGELTRKLITQADAEKRLAEAQDKKHSAQKKITDSVNSIGEKGQAVVKAGNDIVDMLSSLGVEMPEALTGALNGVGTVMDSLANMDLTKPFSILTGVTGTLKGIGQTIGSLFGLGGADYSGYENMKSKYEGLIDIWDSLISKKQQYIDIDYGIEAQKTADEAKKLVDTQISRQRQLAEALMGAGKSKFSRSLGYRVNDRMGGADWQRLSALTGSTIREVADVFRLDADVIGKVLQDEKFVSVLTTVNSEFITYIENIEKYGEQLEEIANQEKEAFTGTSFDEFRDSFISMLSDLDSTSEDFADNFEKYLQNAIFSSLIANKYKDKIQSLYDSWAKEAESGGKLDSTEAERLKAKYQQLVNEMISDRNELMNNFGWKSEKEQQSASGKGFEAMGQDTAEELNGRFTALQVAGEEIKAQSMEQTKGVSILSLKADALLNTGAAAKNIAEETRNIIANSYLELVQISENTGAIVKPIQQMQKDMEEVKRNTSRL